VPVWVGSISDRYEVRTIGEDDWGALS